MPTSSVLLLVVASTLAFRMRNGDARHCPPNHGAPACQKVRGTWPDPLRRSRSGFVLDRREAAGPEGQQLKEGNGRGATSPPDRRRSGTGRRC